MKARDLLATIFTCMFMNVCGQAGDNLCLIQFYLSMADSGGDSILLDCVAGTINQATVQLGPGEQVHILRHCPGCTHCSDAVVGLELHLGSGPGYALITDPVVDTLPLISPGIFIDAPGSYYLRGVGLYNIIVDFTASLRLNVQASATIVDQMGSTSFKTWAVPDGISMEHVPAGVLSVLDMTGRVVYSRHVEAGYGIQTIALPDATAGVHIVRICSADAVVTRKIMFE